MTTGYQGVGRPEPPPYARAQTARGIPMHAAVASAIRIPDLPHPPGLPWIGNAHQMELTHLHQRLEAWRLRYGDVYRVQVWGQSMVVFGDPEVTAAALRERPAT